MYINTAEDIGAAYKAHSDLVDFVEVGRLLDLKTWLKPMSNRLEEGIQVYILYLFYVLFSYYIIFIFIRTISYWNLNEWVRKFLSDQKKYGTSCSHFGPQTVLAPSSRVMVFKYHPKPSTKGRSLPWNVTFRFKKLTPHFERFMN